MTKELTPEAQADLMAGLEAKAKAAGVAEAALIDYRNAINAQYAEIGNSSKMVYTDRETGEVKPWGVNEAFIQKQSAAADDALARLRDALKL